MKVIKPVEYLKLQKLVAEVDVNIAPLVINDFTNCKSEFGGAIFFDPFYETDAATVTNCNFNNCYSANAGGAISIYDKNSRILNSNFTKCSSKFGGAIGVYGDNCTIDNCRFSECLANKTGGALYIRSQNSTLRNSVFTNNAADNYSDWYSEYPLNESNNKIYHGSNLPGTDTTTPTGKTTPQVVKLTLKKVKVKKSAKKLILKATLKINGKAKKGLKLIFKFNGKKYTAKTNKKGVAKVTIKKKILKKLKVGKKVKYQVSYGNKTVKKSVKVKR